MKKLVIEDNTIYEIDEDCIKMKRRIQKQHEQQYKKQNNILKNNTINNSNIKNNISK